MHRELNHSQGGNICTLVCCEVSPSIALTAWISHLLLWSRSAFFLSHCLSPPLVSDCPLLPYSFLYWCKRWDLCELKLASSSCSAVLASRLPRSKTPLAMRTVWDQSSVLHSLSPHCLNRAHFTHWTYPFPQSHHVFIFLKSNRDRRVGPQCLELPTPLRTNF